MKELSIVVASKNTRTTIKHCLTTLIQQYRSDVEVLVVDASVDGSAEIAGAFEKVKLIQASPACLVPELWKIGIDSTTGRWVAFTTANFIPNENWISELHALMQGTHAAVGGVFEKLEPDKISQWAIYFLRYAAYLPSIPPQQASQIAADNAIYQRFVFEKYARLIEYGFWEHPINRMLMEDGYSVLLTPALTVSMGFFSPPVIFFKQRFLHGRIFGADRVIRAGLGRRLFYTLGSPLIPFVLLVRAGHRVIQDNTYTNKFLFALPWIVFYLLGWTLGEVTGYLTGKSSAEKATSTSV